MTVTTAPSRVFVSVCKFESVSFRLLEFDFYAHSFGFRGQIWLRVWVVDCNYTWTDSRTQRWPSAAAVMWDCSWSLKMDKLQGRGAVNGPPCRKILSQSWLTRDEHVIFLLKHYLKYIYQFQNWKIWLRWGVTFWILINENLNSQAIKHTYAATSSFCINDSVQLALQGIMG